LSSPHPTLSPLSSPGMPHMGTTPPSLSSEPSSTQPRP
jgi:hypothetical protein